MTQSQMIDLHRWAHDIFIPRGLSDYTEESDLQVSSQLLLARGSEPRSALITGDVWVLKHQGTCELILDQRWRQWLCNETQWEANDEEFPWWRAPLRLEKQRMAGNQEVQPEAVSCSLDCSISARYLLITRLHLSAQTHFAEDQTRRPELWNTLGGIFNFCDWNMKFLD